MKIVIDIDENVYTRLFDNGIDDYSIVTDDLFAIAKSIRKATPLTDCTDAISREEVLKLKTRIDKYGDMIYAFDVNRLPSVNPTTDLSKIRAKWIKVGEHLYECSCCGYNYRNYDGQVMKFCMNCGSHMEGGE